MPRAAIIYGPPDSGKTTFAIELVKSGKYDGIVAEDIIAKKIMNIMKQRDYWETEGASQVKNTYKNRINYSYLREQLLALEILLFGDNKNLVFEGYGLSELEDRKVLYNVLKKFGYGEVEIFEMPNKKIVDTYEYDTHTVTSYEVTVHKRKNLRHPKPFIHDYLDCVKKFGDI